MNDHAQQRRFFAEEIQMVANVRSDALIEALASVAREAFLPPGPWTVRSEGDMGQPLRQTSSADPRLVYHNVAIGLDPSRMLFNGAPGLLATAIDALALSRGSRVLHVGTGSGYYTAVMAHCVGGDGRVIGVEIDEELAQQAARNLASLPQVEIRQGDGRDVGGEPFDAMLVNAGVTHPLDAWLDALAPRGRLILPLTATLGPMASLGKGLLLLLTRRADETAFDARVVTFVAIFSALGVRDEARNADVARALQSHPFPPLKAMTRASHERTPSCWLHSPGFCLST